MSNGYYINQNDTEIFYPVPGSHDPDWRKAIVHLLVPKEFRVWCAKRINPANVKFTRAVSQCTCANCLTRWRQNNTQYKGRYMVAHTFEGGTQQHKPKKGRVMNASDESGQVTQQETQAAPAGYTCTICGSTFATKQGLGGHVQKCARDHGVPHMGKEQHRQAAAAEGKPTTKKPYTKSAAWYKARKKLMGTKVKAKAPKAPKVSKAWVRTAEEVPASEVLSTVTITTNDPRPATGFRFCPCCGKDLITYIAASQMQK